MTEFPILSEPLQLLEIERITGLSSKAARRFCHAVGGMRCGSLWQLPVQRMPWGYHQSRGKFQPILSCQKYYVTTAMTVILLLAWYHC